MIGRAEHGRRESAKPVTIRAVGMLGRELSAVRVWMAALAAVLRTARGGVALGERAAGDMAFPAGRLGVRRGQPETGKRVRLFGEAGAGRRPRLIAPVAGFATLAPVDAVGVRVAIDATNALDGAENLERVPRRGRRTVDGMTLIAGHARVRSFERKKFIVIKGRSGFPVVLVVAGSARRGAPARMRIGMARDTGLGQAQIGVLPDALGKRGKPKGRPGFGPVAFFAIQGRVSSS